MWRKLKENIFYKIFILTTLNYRVSLYTCIYYNYYTCRLSTFCLLPLNVSLLGTSGPPCGKSDEYLLSTQTVQIILLPFRPRNSKHAAEIFLSTCPTITTASSKVYIIIHVLSFVAVYNFTCFSMRRCNINLIN